MLAKMTAKNQLTLPKSITAAVQRGDAVRAKLAEKGLQEQDITNAVEWARQVPPAKAARKK